MLLEILVFCLGLSIGSFLNVCIYRIPLGQSILYPPSHCPDCRSRLTLRELMPVVSYFLSNRRCRHCGIAISPRYAVVEFLTALLFVWCFFVFGWTGELAAACVFTAFILVIAIIDYDYQLILDKVLFGFLLTGLLIQLPLSLISLSDMGRAVLIGGGLMLLIAIISRGMGDGDVKCSAVLGIWLGWPNILLALFLSFIIGGLAGAILLLTGLRDRKDRIPFGPFICTGAFITLLYGTRILDWYFHLMR